MPDADRRHTSTLLTNLRNRVVDLCGENCRDDLADAVDLFYCLARANQSAVRAERDRMLSLIAHDDSVLESEEQLGLIFQAFAERQTVTALH